MYGWGPDKVARYTVEQQMMYLSGEGKSVVKSLSGEDAQRYLAKCRRSQK